MMERIPSGSGPRVATGRCRPRGGALLLGLVLGLGGGWLPGPARGEERLPPRRIVSLAPAVTETLFALGLGDRVVGASAQCDAPEEARRIERVGSFLQPQVEAILARRPDVVWAMPSPGNRAAVERLRDLGLDVRVVSADSVAEIEAMVEEVARVSGVVDRGAALLDALRRRLAAVAARLEGVTPRSVLLVVGHVPFIAAGAGTLQDELLERAGGRNLAAAFGGRWPNLSVEWVLRQQPEVILDGAMGSEAGASVGVSSFWNSLGSLSAVRDGRVVRLPTDAALRPGPRIADAVEELARGLHPGRFAGAGE